MKFKKAAEVSVPVSKVVTAKFVPKFEVVRKLDKKVVGKVERGAKISAVLTDAKGVQTPPKLMLSVQVTGHMKRTLRQVAIC